MVSAIPVQTRNARRVPPMRAAAKPQGRGFCSRQLEGEPKPMKAEGSSGKKGGKEKNAEKRATAIAGGRSDQMMTENTKPGGIKVKAKGTFRETPLDPLEACAWHLWYQLVAIFQRIGLRASEGKVMGMPSHRKY